MRMAWAMVGTSSNAEAVPPSLHHNGRRNLKTAGLLVLALALLVGVWSSYAWWKRDVPADRLCEAVVQGDVRRVEKLLMEGVSGETRFREQANGAQDGFTLYRLMQLLAGKADRGELSGETVLMRAAYLRNETIVDLLLRHGARPNTIWSQTTALAVASRRGSSQIVRRLLETGADPQSHESNWAFASDACQRERPLDRHGLPHSCRGNCGHLHTDRRYRLDGSVGK
jgi:FOG: Ankyrin repeat